MTLIPSGGRLWLETLPSHENQEASLTWAKLGPGWVRVALNRGFQRLQDQLPSQTHLERVTHADPIQPCHGYTAPLLTTQSHNSKSILYTHTFLSAVLKNNNINNTAGNEVSWSLRHRITGLLCVHNSMTLGFAKNLEMSKWDLCVIGLGTGFMLLVYAVCINFLNAANQSFYCK